MSPRPRRFFGNSGERGSIIIIGTDLTLAHISLNAMIAAKPIGRAQLDRASIAAIDYVELVDMLKVIQPAPVSTAGLFVEKTRWAGMDRR